MRELQGVMYAGRSYINMKRRALLFDKFQIWRYGGAENERPPEFEAEIAFLKDLGIVGAPSLDAHDFEDATSRAAACYAERSGFFAEACDEHTGRLLVIGNNVNIRDCGSRAIAAKVREKSDCDVIPICEIELPAELNASEYPVMGDIVTVGIESLPTPDDSCAWQDIVDFKEEMKGKLWGFRRFLYSLATKGQTEAEIRDDIEWSLNEYTKAMDRFRLKRSISFMGTYIIPTVEAFETFKPSALLKGLISIKKRNLELLEGEAAAPGKELAYVFEAQKRFENPS